MDLCYLYNKHIFYNDYEALFDSFRYVEAIDIATDNRKIDENFPVYIVDVGEIDKTVAEKIRAFFYEKNNPLIFFIWANSGNSAIFYQLAYILQVESIIPHKQESRKVVSTIESSLKDYESDRRSIYLGRFIDKTGMFMLFENKRLSYASNTLTEEFSCSSLNDVERKVCSKLDLDSLLLDDGENFTSGNLFEKSKFDIAKSFALEGKHIVFIDRYEPKRLNCKSQEDLTSRLTYINFLQEHLDTDTADRGDDNFTVLSIKIANFKKIGNVVGKMELESFIREFIYKSKELLDEFLLFSEYYYDFFVVTYKNRQFDEIVSKAERFYEEIDTFLEKFNFKVDIILHVVEIGTMEFSKALSLLDSVRVGKISKKDIKHNKIKYIGRYKEDMSDKEIVALLLDDSFVNDVDLKLVNIYKGMVLDSPTKILKRENDSIYVVVTQIQGAAMSLLKKTVIRSDVIKKDIQAQVTYIDSKRKLAKLENFKVIEPDPVYKQGERVDFAKKNVAIMSLTGSKLSATIIDISATSIALSVSKVRSIENFVSKEVELTFSLPTKRVKDGEITIVENCTIAYIDCKEGSNQCRIVCEFASRYKNKNIIMEYIHLRQMEILEELKNLNY